MGKIEIETKIYFQVISFWKDLFGIPLLYSTHPRLRAPVFRQKLAPNPTLYSSHLAQTSLIIIIIFSARAAQPTPASAFLCLFSVSANFSTTFYIFQLGPKRTQPPVRPHYCIFYKLGPPPLPGRGSLEVFLLILIIWRCCLVFHCLFSQHFFHIRIYIFFWGWGWDIREDIQPTTPQKSQQKEAENEAQSDFSLNVDCGRLRAFLVLRAPRPFNFHPFRGLWRHFKFGF